MKNDILIKKEIERRKVLMLENQFPTFSSFRRNKSIVEALEWVLNDNKENIDDNNNNRKANADHKSFVLSSRKYQDFEQ